MRDRLMSDYEVTLVNDNSTSLLPGLSCGVADIITVFVSLLLDGDPPATY